VRFSSFSPSKLVAVGLLVDVVHPRALTTVDQAGPLLAALGVESTTLVDIGPSKPQELPALLRALRPRHLLGEEDECKVRITASLAMVDALRPLTLGGCGYVDLMCGGPSLRVWSDKAWVTPPEGPYVELADHALAFERFRDLVRGSAIEELRAYVNGPDDAALEELRAKLPALECDVSVTLTLPPRDAVALAKLVTGEHHWNVHDPAGGLDVAVLRWPTGAIATYILAGPDHDTHKAAWLARIDTALGT
jgi:hypothetical protein